MLIPEYRVELLQVLCVDLYEVVCGCASMFWEDGVQFIVYLLRVQMFVSMRVLYVYMYIIYMYKYIYIYIQ